jgi:two-component system sensor histidine kinase DctS
VLATDSVKGAPKLLPNLLVGSVIVLALGLRDLLALWRHIARTLAAENALRQQMAFRTAMENSLLTGLRARDLEGRVTYVNPAFCRMVGLPPEDLLGKKPPMPYWAPEAMASTKAASAGCWPATITPQFETVFQRSDGVRVPVLVFEAPLVDSRGRHTGWMSSILDITDRKRAEELNRQQQEKLETSARLATMGEISSMLAHELNQPLAAISSYTAGALNVLARADPWAPLEPAC